MAKNRIKILSILGAASIAVGGASVASGNEANAPRESVQTEPTVSAESTPEQGEDYFKEIFFGVGENVDELQKNIDNGAYDRVAAASPEDPEGKVQYSQFVDQTVERIKQDDPTYFDEFEREITSGDPFAVENAVAETSTVINDIIAVEVVEEEDVVNGYCLWGPAVFAAAVWDAAIVVNYGALVNVYAGVLVKAEIELAGARNVLAGESGEISKQDLVAGITKTYASV